MRELKGNWKDLFKLFRISLHIPKLALGALGLFVSLLTAGGLTTYFGYRGSGAGSFKGYLLEKLIPGNGSDSRSFLSRLGDLEFEATPLENIHELTLGFLKLPFSAYRDIGFSGGWQLCLFTVGIALLLVLIWAYFGNAIARIAGLEITRDERIELSEAFSYSSEKYGANVMSFLLPVIGFLFFWVVVWLVALLVNVPYLGALVLVGLPLALLGGFIMSLIIVGTAGGFPLFIPSIAVEGTDSFDAISRGFSYVLSRAWHYIWNWVVALVYGSICTAFVLFFAYLMVRVVNTAGLYAVAGDAFEKIISVNVGDADGSVKLAAAVYYGWIFVFQLFALAYGISYFFSSSTMVYLLMRKRVDGIDMEEIYEDLDEEEELFFEDEDFDDASNSDIEDFDEDEEVDLEDEDEEEKEEESEQQSSCPECGRTFDTEFGRDQHYRQVHKKDEEDEDEE